MEDEIVDLDKETCKECISEHFSMALKMMVKLELLDEQDMIADIHKILNDVGFDVKDNSFDIKKIKKTIQSEQIRPLVPNDTPGTSQDNEEYSFTVSDEEILNEIDSGNEDDDDIEEENIDHDEVKNNKITDEECANKISFVYESEHMEE